MIKTVQGDLLNAKEPVIVQQLNCLCVRPHGLSKTITAKYPYADVYGQRKQLGFRNLSVVEDRGTPGGIVVSRPPNDNGHVVIGLYGQYDYGKPGKSIRSTLEQDNYTLRKQWFKESLNKLSEWLIENNIDGVAFPYLIGCGLGGGKWIDYYQMINDFAKNKPFDVTIYQL